MHLNINLDKTVNYADLQSQIVEELIQNLKGTDTLGTTQNGPDPTAPNLTFFIRQQAEVFLSHSLADRNYLMSHGDEGALVKGFQMVLVPGEWTRKALLAQPGLGLTPRRVVAVGHPRIDLLHRLQALTPARSPVEGGRRRVLWAPAHDRHGGPRGGHVSSYPGFIPHLEDLQAHHDVIACLHPRNRKGDKAALTQELVDCDVVISDVSSVIFEAWALGKPVIFPRWIVQDAVIERFGAAAEAHIHRARIGLHADSFDELLEILERGPEIGADVRAFMAQYLVNHTMPDSSAARILSAVRPLLDPDLWVRLAQQESALAGLAALAARKGAVGARTGAARASIQMLQLLALQDQPDSFAQTLATLRAVQARSAQLMAEVALVECDYRLTGLAPTLRAGMIQRLEQLDATSANLVRARLALLEGQSQAGLAHLQQAVASNKTHGYGTWRLLALAMQQLDLQAKILPLFERIWTQYKAPEVLEDMLAFDPTPEGALAVLSCLPALRDVAPPAVVQDLEVRALSQAAHVEDALAMARKAAVAAVAREPGWRHTAAPALEGWGPKQGMPLWQLPFEALDVLALAKGGARWLTGLKALCSAIEAEDLPLFLSRATLRHACAQTAPEDPLAALELGLIWRPDGPAILERLARAALLEPVGSDRPQDARWFRLPNGVAVAVLLHHPEGAALRLTEDGVETRLPRFDLVQDTVGGRSLRRPADTQAYLAACFGSDSPAHAAYAPLLSGRDVTITDPDRLRLRLYRDVVHAHGAGDMATARACEQILRDLGDRDLWIHLDKMDKAHFCADLPGLLQQARFILHIGDGIEADFHVDLWYPYLQSVDPSTILAIRSKPLFELLRHTRPDLPAVYIKAGIEAEWLVSNCPRLVAVHYVSNTGNTVHFLRFNHVSHIFLGHGDSEKAASSHKFFRAYDEVWTAGRAHIDRFRATGMNHDGLRFRVVGRPTLRSLLEAEADGETFLYLPTWEGFQVEQDYTSIRAAEVFIPGIATLTGRMAVVKFHPWAGKRETSFHQIEGRLTNPPSDRQAAIEVVQRSEPAADRMKSASFLISDISSVVSDFLPTGRPIFLFIPADRQVRTSTSSMPMESYCYVFHDPEMLHDLVRRVIVQGDDWLRETRLRARDYFVDSARTRGMAFEQTLRDLLDEHETPVHPWAVARAQTPATAPLTLPRVVGHRGAKGLWPENSLSGFVQAGQMAGLDAVEFDLHLTADGEIVVLHDPTLERTTTGTGPVGALSLTDLRALRLKGGTKIDQVILDEGIPTLDEVLEILGPGGKDLHIELKNDALGAPYPGLAEKVLARLKAAGVAGRSVLTSFSAQVLQDIRALDAEIPLLASVNYRSMEQMGGAAACLDRLGRIPGCVLALEGALMAPLMQMQPGLIDPRRVGLWVLNDETAIREAIALGVRQITSDRPDIVIKHLNKGCA